MRIALVLLFLFLLILFMPIKLRSKIDFNVFINEGIFSLFFFKLKIMLAKLEFSKNKKTDNSYLSIQCPKRE